MFFGLEKKHIRILNLVLVIVLGISSGYLFATVVGLYLARQEPPGEISTQRKSLSFRTPPLQAYQSILTNNLFDPEGRKKPNALSVAEGQRQGEDKPVRTDLTLLGTVTSRHFPLAVFLINREEHIVRLGEEIPGGGVLEEIYREEVRIRDKSGRIYAVNLDGVSPSAPGSAASGPPSARDGADMEGIREVGENRWIISGQAAQKAKDNMGEIMKQTRLEPEAKNGQVEGFRVVMIRPQTLLWHLGLKQGDIIREVNGIQLDNAEKALHIYQQLKEAQKISVVLQREDQNLALEYEVE